MSALLICNKKLGKTSTTFLPTSIARYVNMRLAGVALHARMHAEHKHVFVYHKLYQILLFVINNQCKFYYFI